MSSTVCSVNSPAKHSLKLVLDLRLSRHKPLVPGISFIAKAPGLILGYQVVQKVQEIGGDTGPCVGDG